MIHIYRSQRSQIPDYMIAQEEGHCNCHLVARLEMAAATRAAPRPERLDIKLK